MTRPRVNPRNHVTRSGALYHPGHQEHERRRSFRMLLSMADDFHAPGFSAEVLFGEDVVRQPIRHKGMAVFMPAHKPKQFAEGSIISFVDKPTVGRVRTRLLRVEKRQEGGPGEITLTCKPLRSRRRASS